MNKSIKSVSIFIITIILCYAIINLALYFYQDNLIFFPRKLSDGSYEVLKNKEYEINITVDNVALHGWLLNKGEKKLIIYYGGNAEEVSANINDMKDVERYSILLMNYRGYGMSEGSPGEQILFSDALSIFDQVTIDLNIQSENVILFGRSLGSGIAVYVASKRKVSKLILVSPFDSLRDIAKGHYPIFPVGLLLKHPFDSMVYAKEATAPSLMIMGGRDKIIPNNHSLKLAENWIGDCKTVLINNAGHNDIQAYPEYWEAITEYLKQ